MTWVRLDDHFDEHPKMARVGPLGIALWTVGLAYCNRNLTDGFIPWAVAQHLLNWEFLGKPDANGRRKRYSIDVSCGMMGEDVDSAFVIDLLVDAGLWEVRDEGYYIHDYPDYQPLKAEIEEMKDAKRRAGQAGGQASAQARGQAPAQAESKHLLKQKIDDLTGIDGYKQLSKSDDPLLETLMGDSRSIQARAQARAQAESNPVPDPVPRPLDLLPDTAVSGPQIEKPDSKLPPKKPGKTKAPPDPRVTEILKVIEEHWGSPIVCWAKEAVPVKQMLRGNRDPTDIVRCWDFKSQLKNSGWIPLAFVAQDIHDFLQGRMLGQNGTGGNYGRSNLTGGKPGRNETESWLDPELSKL